MESKVSIETEDPEQLESIVGKSLESGEKVDYNIKSGKENLTVEVEANGLGPLRGCTDTVFRLVSLADKLY